MASSWRVVGEGWCCRSELVKIVVLVGGSWCCNGAASGVSYGGGWSGCEE